MKQSEARQHSNAHVNAARARRGRQPSPRLLDARWVVARSPLPCYFPAAAALSVGSVQVVAVIVFPEVTQLVSTVSPANLGVGRSLPVMIALDVAPLTLADAPRPARPAHPANDLDHAITMARAALLARQDEKGFWCAELQGDSILESEYILMKFILS